MNKDEITKALECCSGNSIDGCKDCSYYYIFNCNNPLCKDALTLITEQEQEIAELKAAKNDWKQRYESLDQRYMALVASSTECIDKKVKKAKIEVLNKLRERVETAIDAYFNLDGGGYYLAEGAMNDIDELLKEYENDT